MEIGVRFQFLPRQNPLTSTDARGHTTSYGYEDETQPGAVPKQITEPLGRSTAIAMDVKGTLGALDIAGERFTYTSRTIQDGSRESSRYDPEGNRLAKTTFAGETITYQYDSGNRLSAQLVPAASGGVPAAVVSYSYTASGQLASQAEQGASTLSGTQSYRYDSGDRLLSVSSPIGQIGYAYDPQGNLVERSVAGAGTTRHAYDDAGRLTGVTAPDGKQARYGYDAAGRLATVERDLNAKEGQAQALVTHHRYDRADRLVAIAEVKRVGSSESLVAGQALTRGAGGMIERIDTHRSGSSFDSASGQFAGAPARTQTFGYDRNARLTRETSAKAQGSIDTAYEYDAAGNRSKKMVTTAAGVEITTYTYDSADRLVREEVSLPGGGARIVTYTWGGNGNLASKTEPGKVTLCRFDAQNRLIDIRSGASMAEAQAAAPSISYAYDASGNRIRKSTPQGTVGYLIDGSHAYAQVALEKMGDQSTTYVRGLQLIRQTRGSGLVADDVFPLQGHLGGSLGAVDADGNLVEQVEADAFGVRGDSSGLRQTHLYTGEYWDREAQLVYLRARWYEPKVGRFVSGDPFEGKQSDPRSLNRYGYAHNDPAHHVDPSGRMIGSLSFSPAISGISNAVASAVAANTLRTLAFAAGRSALAGALGRVAALAANSATMGIVSQFASSCIRNGAVDQNCNPGFHVFIVGDLTPAHRQFVADSINAGYRFSLNRREPPHNRDWLRKAGCRGSRDDELDCDEYPYASAEQGGENNPVNMRILGAPDNRLAGTLLNAFYTRCRIQGKLKPGDQFFVLPLTGAPTVGLCAK